MHATGSVQAALALAEKVEDNSSSFDKEAWELASRIAHLSDLKSQFLPLEEEANKRVTSEISRDKKELEILTAKREKSSRFKFLASKYHRLSFKPLTWRDDQGYPRLVPFSLETPFFRISSEENWNCHVCGDFNFPYKQAKKLYSDVHKKVESARKEQRRKGYDDGSAWVLECRFQDTIPPQIRAKIKEAKADFPSLGIFIVAEARGWEIQKITRTLSGDPLVVGYDEKADENSLWLIADFETTPVEEAMIFTLPDHTQGEE